MRSWNGPLLMALIVMVSVSTAMSLETPEDTPEPTRAPPTIGHEIEYMIVTTSDLEGSFETLSRWRSQAGLRSEVFVLDGEDGILTGPGNDDAERLLNFISEAYEVTEGGLKYVLLGGDAGIVPIRYLYAGAGYMGLDDLYLSDVYYSSPVMDWDADKDGKFGEIEDLISYGIDNISFPVTVGRVPVNNTSDADLFCQRVIDYENDPPEGDWYSRAIMASSVMDRPNVEDDPLTPTDEGYNSYKDNGFKAIYNTLRYIPRSMDIIHLHDYQIDPPYRGGNYTEENDTLKGSSFPENISHGCSIATFSGQSFYDSSSSPFSLANWVQPTGTQYPPSAGFGTALTRDDIDTLSNGGMLPVMYISSCDSLNFSGDDDQDLESLIYAPGGGAISVVGSTGVSWRGEGEEFSLGNWYLMPLYWRNLMLDQRPGDALYDLKETYLKGKWDELSSQEALLVGAYTYNYFGDPALKAWTSAPQPLKVSADRTSLYSGKDTLTVQVRDLADTPIYDATVSIYQPATGNVFSGRTGPDGSVEIETDLTSSGPLRLTVTANGFLPNIKNLSLIEAPLDLEVSHDSMSIGPQIPSEGSEMNVTATVTNLKGGPVEDVTISLFSKEMQGDPGTWSSPEAQLTVGIPVTGHIEVSFLVYPNRAWDRVTIFVEYQQDEVVLENNVAMMPIRVNAAPVFFAPPYLEMDEDPPGQVQTLLSEFVFDPDNSSDDLLFHELEQHPSWIWLEPCGRLTADPPANWSGSVSFKVRVSDGLAYGDRAVRVIVAPVNDAPSLVGIKKTYNATVDQLFKITLHPMDAEGDAVLLDLTTDLLNLSIVSNTLRFVPYPGDEGAHELKITASDPHGGSRSYNITLIVESQIDLLYFREPSIHLPDAWEGKDYRYEIDIGGGLSEGAVFTDNTTLFDIDPDTGVIEFRPGPGDVGEHWVRIDVTSGNVTITRSFTIEVRQPREVSSSIFWLLGGAMALVIILIVAAYMWSGPPIEQYGLEE